jgi:hypothetical protein
MHHAQLIMHRPQLYEKLSISLQFSKMRKTWKPVNLAHVKTYPIRERVNKVSVRDFARPPVGYGLNGFIETLPKILKAADFQGLVDRIVTAYQTRKPVIAMLGGHVVKCGLSLILVDLMERGVITALALNGASSIHDFEIALIGETSEDVGEYIRTGQFGMVEETGRLMNEAFCEAAKMGVGMGEGLGRKLVQLDAPYNNYSLLAAGVRLGIPITVHVAIGTDIIHQHPLADGAAIGEASFTDFRLLTAVVAELGDGGVVLNFGSAVILPEAFLKALTIARNLGHRVTHFTTANFDMIQHYRPMENVVRRPTNEGGQGYAFTGHHEIMIPLLANTIVARLSGGKE